jgi:beta-phosphoglucomutase-like phosphatase (HAD superfamily)
LINTFLAATDLTRLVTVAVSSEQVPAGKPAPDVYLEAARRLGSRPSLVLPSRTARTASARRSRPA